MAFKELLTDIGLGHTNMEEQIKVTTSGSQGSVFQHLVTISYDVLHCEWINWAWEYATNYYSNISMLCPCQCSQFLGSDGKIILYYEDSSI